MGTSRAYHERTSTYGYEALLPVPAPCWGMLSLSTAYIVGHIHAKNDRLVIVACKRVAVLNKWVFQSCFQAACEIRCAWVQPCMLSKVETLSMLNTYMCIISFLASCQIGALPTKSCLKGKPIRASIQLGAAQLDQLQMHHDLHIANLK